MVTVEMRNKNVINLAESRFCFPELYLRSFAAVDQETAFFHFQKLRGGR